MTERRTEGHVVPTYERHDGQEVREVGRRIPTDVRPANIRRISWGAIFAGTAVMFVA
jgi:hypothetical protein